MIPYFLMAIFTYGFLLRVDKKEWKGFESRIALIFACLAWPFSLGVFVADLIGYKLKKGKKK